MHKTRIKLQAQTAAAYNNKMTLINQTQFFQSSSVSRGPDSQQRTAVALRVNVPDYQ